MKHNLHILLICFVFLGIYVDVAHYLSTSYDKEQQCELEVDSESESEAQSEKDKDRQRNEVYFSGLDQDLTRYKPFPYLGFGTDHIEGVPSPPPEDK